MTETRRGWLSLIVLVAFLVGILGLSLGLEENQRQTAENQKLSVAIVNEDQPVKSDGESIALGESYIKSLEQEDDQNYSVVSRARASSGLNQGDYQLMLIIPSDFSKKVLAVNDINVDKATITYKVNAKGNQAIETEATKVGKDMVASLNSRLVDMYMASILSNLYTAQENVKTMAGLEAENITAYSQKVLGQASDFRANLPGFGSFASNLLSLNDSLTASIDGTTSSLSSLSSATTDTATNLSELILARQSADLSYGEFMTGLMGLNSDLLSGELATLTDSLATTQKELSESLAPSTENASTAEENYQKEIEALDKQIAALETAAKAQETALANQISSTTDGVTTSLETYYGKEVNKLTLRDFLAKDPTLATSMTAYETTIKTLVQNSLNALPQASASQVNSLLMTGSVTEPNLPAGFTGGTSNLYADLSAAKSAYDTARSTVVTASSSTPSTSPASASPLSVTVTVNGTETSDYTINGNATNTLDPTVSNTISLGSDVLASQDGASASVTIQTSAANSSASGQTTSESIDLTDYATKAATFARLSQEVVDAYAHANQMLDSLYPSGLSLSDSLLNASVGSALTDLVSASVTSSLTSYSDAVAANTEIQTQLTKLKANRDQMAKTLVSLQTSNTKLATQLDSQMTALTKLQATASDLINQGNRTSEANSQTSTGLSNLSSQLASLISQSDSTRSASESNASQSASVRQQFESFDRSLATAQSQADALANDAQGLMTQFNQELASSHDFVASFSKVFNNAYQNGVANDVLIAFLSSPVAQESSSIQAAALSYRPFIWVLLLAGVAFFSAYVFESHRFIKRTVDKLTRKTISSERLMETLLLTGVGLLEGLVIGILSARQLVVRADLVPVWVLLISLFGSLLVQGNFLLMRQLKTLGLGLILFGLLSYVFVTNSFGTSLVLSGFPAQIKRLNPLVSLEAHLTSFLEGLATRGHYYGLLILGISLLCACNALFDWKQISRLLTRRREA
ncbi:type VII secretion protein EsaA [Streptococcus sp. DD12]|uniref:type VII secretion protein EsaA n=1 Tax=Streptococcus sp. DD12 TaxID=1777880 RepID=UPI00079AB62C|nr:type VII secretion protein EsaA [Streptococcus sp. DD12]KXT75910.1 hypothetical protein STRDD12_01022 [Streptococcus sp. DD12]